MSSITKESVAAAATAQVAVTYLATMATLEVMAIWKAVAGQGSKGAATFVRQAARVIGLRSRQISQITAAEIRLQRTLRTGTPLVLPDFDGRTFKVDASLNEIREDFVDTVKEYAPEALKPNPKIPKVPRKVEPPPPVAPATKFEPYRKPSARAVDLDPIKGERIAKLEQQIRREEAATEAATEAALRGVMKKIAKLEAQKKARKKAREAVQVDDPASKRGPADELAEDLAMQMRQVGNIAWSAARARAARMEATVAQADRSVIGYIRMHSSFDGSNPCAFCAALLSRGAVYKSAAKAGGGIGAITQYHPNCRCKGVAIYKGEDPMSGDDPRFEANRFYADLWQTQVRKKGLRGDYARKGWRNLIDSYNRGQWQPGAA